MVSTWITKPEVHVEHVASLVKMQLQNIIANDKQFAVAA